MKTEITITRTELSNLTATYLKAMERAIELSHRAEYGTRKYMTAERLFWSFAGKHDAFCQIRQRLFK